MEFFKEVPMEFENKDYEIRVLYKDNLINVVTFLNNYPANGYRHQILLPKGCNVKNVLKKGIADDLIELSKTDIIEKKVGKFSRLIKENLDC